MRSRGSDRGGQGHRQPDNHGPDSGVEGGSGDEAGVSLPTSTGTTSKLRLLDLSDLVKPRALGLGIETAVFCLIGYFAISKTYEHFVAVGNTFDPPELPLASIIEGIKEKPTSFAVDCAPTDGLHPTPRDVVATTCFVHNVGDITVTNRHGKPVVRTLYRLTDSSLSKTNSVAFFVHAPKLYRQEARSAASDSAIDLASSTLPPPELPNAGSANLLKVVFALPRQPSGVSFTTSNTNSMTTSWTVLVPLLGLRSSDQ
jgi:hypothetical protein